MRKFFKSRWFYRIVALICTLILFVYLNHTAFGIKNFSEAAEENKIHSTKMTSLNVPLRLNMNNKEYFVTGQPASIKVKLKGPAGLVSNNANTQYFKAYADLYPLGVGKHTVKIHYDGIPASIHPTFYPDKIHVNIQPRESKTFAVEPKFNGNQIMKGYKAGKATSKTTLVTAIGSAAEINRIKRIVADINLSRNSQETVNRVVPLVAIDGNNKTINVILSPSTTKVHLPISKK